MSPPLPSAAPTRRALARRIALPCLVLVLPACVTTTSMFRDASALASARSGFTPTHRPVEDDPDVARSLESTESDDAAIRRLLAEPIGPNEAIRIALAQSPELQASFEELGVARADLLGASLPPNLEFDLEARLGRRSAQAGDEVEAHVVVDVTDLVTLPFRRAAAMAEVEAAQVEAAEAVLDVAFEVRSAFVEHVAAIRLRDAMADVVRATEAASALATALYEAGNVPRLHAVSEQAMLEESRLWLRESELEVLDTREVLVLAMGLSSFDTEGDDAFEVRVRLDDPAATEVELERLEARVLDQNLHLSASRHSLEALAGRERVARIEGALPELRAGASGSLADGQLAYGPAVSLGIPLWNQGQGTTRRYEAEIRVALRRYQAEAISVRSSVRRARNRLVNARERVLALRDSVLPLRAQVLAETVLQYNAMQATPFQVLEARRAEVESTRTYLATLREYWLARASLVHALAGGTLHERAERSSPSEAF